MATLGSSFLIVDALQKAVRQAICPRHTIQLDRESRIIHCTAAAMQKAEIPEVKRKGLYQTSHRGYYEHTKFSSEIAVKQQRGLFQLLLWMGAGQ